MFPSEIGTIVPKWDWYVCSEVKLVRLFPREAARIVFRWTGTIFIKWDWHDCSQVRLMQLLPSESGAIVLRWDWHSCSQVRLAQLFPSNTGMIVPKWDWCDWSPVRLDTLFSKWDWHYYSQVSFDSFIWFLFCSLSSGTYFSLASSRWEELWQILRLSYMIFVNYFELYHFLSIFLLVFI